MFETKYLVRAPLLDPQQNVLGYKLGTKYSYLFGLTALSRCHKKHLIIFCKFSVHNAYMRDNATKIVIV